MKRIFLTIFMLFCFCEAQDYFNAKLDFVKDGDTIDFIIDNNKITCRAYGIDSPEKYDSNKLKKEAKKYNISPTKITNAGKKASYYTKQYFSQNQYYQIATFGKDRYNRYLCLISDNDRGFFNRNIILDGFAVLYKNGKYIKDSKLRSSLIGSQATANANKNGLWLDFEDLMGAMVNE